MFDSISKDLVMDKLTKNALRIFAFSRLCIPQVAEDNFSD